MQCLSLALDLHVVPAQDKENGQACNALSIVPIKTSPETANSAACGAASKVRIHKAFYIGENGLIRPKRAQ